MFRWGRASVAYALIAMGALATGLGFERGSLLSYPGPWLPLDGAEGLAFSLVLGAAFAAAVVVGTRVLVENVGWAKNLHRDLRPMTLRLDGAGIVVIAALSAVVPQALLFGVVHAQLSGPSRWVWVAWASVVGLALGAIFALSGSLLGAMLAHATINGLNLLYLKSHDTAPPRNSLGGLLSDAGRRSPVPAATGGVPGRRSPLPAGRRA
jgi:membrane protease YdiL (CAAX protease family)